MAVANGLFIFACNGENYGKMRYVSVCKGELTTDYTDFTDMMRECFVGMLFDSPFFIRGIRAIRG